MVLAVETQDLRRVYRSSSVLGRTRETVALDGLSLEVPEGIVFGLLGPNGAGKTTTVRILSTLLTPSSGRAQVQGFDVVRQAKEVRKRIGLVLGSDRGLYGRLSGQDNLRYFAALNYLSARESKTRIRALLDQVGLAESADRLVEQYSRGMRQRLHIARGLLTDPEVLFLDEPTLGLDPAGAQELRQLVPRLVAAGKTVLLTTHYMFEADALCQQIGIIAGGRLIAKGTPSEIKRTFSRLTVAEFVLRELRPDKVKAIEALPGVHLVTVAAEGMFHRLTVQARPEAGLGRRLAALFDESDVEASAVRDPTLEEAYLSIVR